MSSTSASMRAVMLQMVVQLPRCAAHPHDYKSPPPHQHRQPCNQQATVVQNLPHDEEVDLGSSDSLDESVDTEAGGGSPGGPPRSRSPAGGPRGDSPPAATEESHGHGEYDDHVEIPGQVCVACVVKPQPVQV